MHWMVDGVPHSLLLGSDPYMARELGEVDDVAEALSPLWYRAVYGEEPPANRIKSAHALLAMRSAPPDGAEP